MIAGCHRQSQSLRIFVVENHADTLRCLADYLQAMGHTVTTATTTTQALATPALALCDVLVSELRFPVSDGWELLRTIRLSRPIYAIAISALGMPEERARSRVAGFQHHLLKPFSLAHLDAALEQAAKALTVGTLG